MQVLDLEEQEDGSAIVTFDMKPWEMQFFLELGVVEAIKRGVDETQKGLKAKEEESGSEDDESIQQTLNLREPEEGTEEEGGAE